MSQIRLLVRGGLRRLSWGLYSAHQVRTGLNPSHVQNRLHASAVNFPLGFFAGFSTEYESVIAIEASAFNNTLTLTPHDPHSNAGAHDKADRFLP
ncbi:hypothetical protein OG21DRAFT_1486315 [Imleria badia]|nr:hypothetical protein OG21DRAFT_1486315 [Imleria badia]